MMVRGGRVLSRRPTTATPFALARVPASRNVASVFTKQRRATARERSAFVGKSLWT